LLAGAHCQATACSSLSSAEHGSCRLDMACDVTVRWRQDSGGNAHCMLDAWIDCDACCFAPAAGDPWDTFRRTLSGRFYVPHFISDAAADLIFKLLQVWQAQGHKGSSGRRACAHSCLALCALLWVPCSTFDHTVHRLVSGRNRQRCMGALRSLLRSSW
jgi:hypothetical protein